MSIAEIIALLRKRLSYNEQRRAAAENRGDIAEISVIDADSATTQASINALEALL